MAVIASLVAFAASLLAQAQISVADSTTTSACVVSAASPTYSAFTYQQRITTRYATALPAPLSLPTFAPAFNVAATLLPTAVTYTTYSLDPAATSVDDGPYGQSAYAGLWSNYSYTEQPPFTTTVSPTPVASSELIFPPPFPARAMNENPSLKLPCDFIWGVAASAWQIEGGLQVEGRGPSNIDNTGSAGKVSRPGNDSNVADMSYFLYKQDIARLAAIGVPYYSFSISWSRVVPFGAAGSPINTQALDHYEDVIKTCYEYGITPIVTLWHIEHPVGLLDDLDALPDHFLYYAKQVMTRYGDRVPIWFTINEPTGVIPYETADFNVITAELRAHAKVYHWYKEELKGTGQISTKLSNNLAVPLDVNDPTHVQAAFRYQDFNVSIMANAIFLGQQIPDAVLETPGINMTALTDEELAYINGTADFLAIDPYVAQFAYPPDESIEACASNPSNGLWPMCVATTNTQQDGWLMGNPSEAYPMIAPQYVRDQLGYLWNTFRPAGGIMITEFGFPQRHDAENSLQVQQFDLERSLYYRNFLTEALRAVHLDGVRVIGALAWSWIDNNEFGDFGKQYGMQVVDRTDGAFTRHFKRRVFDYVDFFHDSIASASVR